MLSCEGRFRRCLIALAAVTMMSLVAGCGVKSKPAMPDGSTFPREYPAQGARETTTGSTPAPRATRPAPATAPAGTYTPPPAATDPNFR